MEMQIADRWLMDMPQQFLGKHNIEVLVKAFARQLQELQVVFDDLNTELDLETAAGKNLDYVGTILPLSRKEAGELAEVGAAEPVISDERYRRFMKYKILRNTSECTYYDLVAGIELLWKYENIHYIEDPKHPAMIIFETPMLSLDEADPVEFHANLCIRASGVGVMLRKIYGADFPVHIRCAEVITFTMAFYPQFNRPELFLDNTWNLNGDMELSGYHMDGRVDLYPVGIKLLAAARAAPKEETGIVFLSGAEGAVSSSQQTGMCVPAMCREAAKESIVVQAEAEVDAEGGAVLMDNLNCLDDEWKLDGGRELNGGTYWL